MGARCQNAAKSETVIILCGNKKDLDADREVTFLEASRFAQENGLMFLETSALTGENVEEAFMQCARKILNKIQSGELDPERMGSGIQFGDSALRQLRSARVHRPQMHRSVAARHASSTGSVAVSGAQLLEPEESGVSAATFSALHRSRSSWGEPQCTPADRAQQPHCELTQWTVPLDATHMQRSAPHGYPFLFRETKLVLHTAWPPAPTQWIRIESCIQ
ncbi:Ras-related protein Rab-4A [Lemmus lemmus]